MSDSVGGRLKVLLIAYACSPGRGSEPKSGWNRAIRTQQYCDTWVICEEQESRGAIESYGAKANSPPLPNFVYVSLTPFEVALSRTPGLYYVAYNLWHRRAYRVARDLHASVRFDVVHQATMCGYREPGYCWRLNVPFVWGPLGGTQNYPWRYLRIGGLPGAVREGARSILNRIQLRFSRRVKTVANQAAVILAGNSTCISDFRNVLGVECQLMTTTGLPKIQPNMKEKRADSTLRIVWSGPHNYSKGLFLLIKALESIEDSIDFRLTILGSGPESRRWQLMAEKAAIADRCEWTGQLPYVEALEYFDKADVFAFTSLRDTAANVVLEALSAGVPVVCFDLQGAADVVTDDCGIKIPVGNVRESIRAYGAALARLSRDRALLNQLSQNASDRARRYSWDGKVRDTVAIYRKVADRERPGFPGTARKTDDHRPA